MIQEEEDKIQRQDKNDSLALLGRSSTFSRLLRTFRSHKGRWNCRFVLFMIFIKHLRRQVSSQMATCFECAMAHPQVRLTSWCLYICWNILILSSEGSSWRPSTWFIETIWCVAWQSNRGPAFGISKSVTNWSALSALLEIQTTRHKCVVCML